MIDFDPAAVTARLREVGRLLEARGFVPKRIDMRPAAVTARLRVMAGLSDMCRELSNLGQGLRTGR